MYTPTQLEAIKLFGRKDLTEGCIIRHFYNGTYGTFLGHSNDKSAFDCHISYDGGNIIDSPDASDIRKCILGHIPHLEDLFRVAENKGFDIDVVGNENHLVFYRINRFEEFTNIGNIEYTPSIPLLDQPSLPDIISLFK